MNARIRWLRSQWPTSTAMSGVPVYLLVMGTMAVVAIHGYVYAQRHLYVEDALSIMTGPGVTMMEYRAVSGAWPPSDSHAVPVADAASMSALGVHRVSSVHLRTGGAMDFSFSGKPPGVLTIRAWTPPGDGL